MITRENIRELAQFQTTEDQDCALSFYFEPHTPQNRSHKEDAILAKDVIRNAMREHERKGRNGATRADLTRMLEIAEQLQGSQSGSKAIFACGPQNFWREFELPPLSAGTQLFVNRQFHLKPLAQLLGAQPVVWVVLVDRHKARFFDLRLDEITEREGFFRTPPKREGKSDGYAGYDGGHAQRRIEDEALHHFRNVASYLLEAFEKKQFEKLIVGCQDVNWSDFETELHPYVKETLAGHFSADMSKLGNEQIREHATRVLNQAQNHRRLELVREVLDQAKSNSRGVTGLRRVLRSLEMGEVQTILIGENYAHAAAECENCGHLEPNPVNTCAACSHATRQIADVCDAIIATAIRRDLEVFYVANSTEFDDAGNIAALLRFRADQNMNMPVEAAS